ncbi:MAG: guanylate kinase, partial [Bacteroidetes bacterium]|nr:guanylate kinase [Bacteroidota bacterium]
MHQGKLIIFSAPSGSGKTTIVRHLLETDPRLAFSVSACTREKRTHEVDGKDYYFLTEQDFKEKIESNEFVEWEEVYAGHFYGTLKSEIERLWSEGKHILFDIDVEGGLNIKHIYKEKALAVFVKPISIEVIKHRLTHRSTETPEKQQMRIAKAEKELAYENQFDKVLINDVLETAF